MSELKGRVLVTSGPTRAYFDRVRYIANTSSGALGTAIVERLAAESMPVTHIVGPGVQEAVVPAGADVRVIPVVTVEDVIAAVEYVCCGDVTAVVHAMAVLDYVPERCLQEKKKSGGDVWNVSLVRTPKIIAHIRNLCPGAIFVGFKLEAGIGDDELAARALRLLETYRLDAVVANDIDRVGPVAHEALLVGPGGIVLGKTATKASLADTVASFVKGKILSNRSKR